MIESATQFWLFIAAFIIVGVAYFKAAWEAIRRIMRRK